MSRSNNNRLHVSALLYKAIFITFVVYWLPTYIFQLDIVEHSQRGWTVWKLYKIRITLQQITSNTYKKLCHTKTKKTVTNWPVMRTARSPRWGDLITLVRGVLDKSLIRPNSRCRRTESIVVGKRGLFMCRIASLFLLQRAERKHVRRRARFQQHRDVSCHNFFSCKARRRRKFTPFWHKH